MNSSHTDRQINRITLLSNSKGGVRVFTENLASTLERRDCRVNVFYLTQVKDSENSRRYHSEKIRFNYFTGLNFVPNLRSIYKLLFHDRPNIIHTNFASLGLLAVLKKLTFKTPFFLTIHGLPQIWLEPSLRSKLKFLFEKMLLPLVARHATAIVAVSHFVRDALKKEYHLDSVVIHNGIDASKFKHYDKAESKKLLNYKEADLLVLFVGQLHPCKDPLTLIRAFYKASKANKRLNLIMIGSGELYKEVVQLVGKYCLSSRVRLLQQLNEQELNHYYSASDFFVLPSINEAFGIVLLEAMAHSKPVIASSSGACAEIVGEAGVMFKQGNYHELAEKIITLSYNPILRKKLGQKAVRRVLTFSLKEATDRYWKLFNKDIRVHV